MNRYQEPQIFEVNSFVKCILPRKSMPGNASLSEDAKKIEEVILARGEITINDLMEMLSLSRPTIWRRVQELLNKGVVERIGHTRSKLSLQKRHITYIQTTLKLLNSFSLP